MHFIELMRNENIWMLDDYWILLLFISFCMIGYVEILKGKSISWASLSVLVFRAMLLRFGWEIRRKRTFGKFFSFFLLLGAGPILKELDSGHFRIISDKLNFKIISEFLSELCTNSFEILARNKIEFLKIGPLRVPLSIFIRFSQILNELLLKILHSKKSHKFSFKNESIRFSNV